VKLRKILLLVAVTMSVMLGLVVWRVRVTMRDVGTKYERHYDPKESKFYIDYQLPPRIRPMELDQVRPAQPRADRERDIQRKGAGI
jgi:hypothetical protein